MNYYIPPPIYNDIVVEHENPGTRLPTTPPIQSPGTVFGTIGSGTVNQTLYDLMGSIGGTVIVSVNR